MYPPMDQGRRAKRRSGPLPPAPLLAGRAVTPGAARSAVPRYASRLGRSSTGATVGQATTPCSRCRSAAYPFFERVAIDRARESTIARTVSVIHDHLPLGEAAVEGLRVLDQLDPAVQLIGPPNRYAGKSHREIFDLLREQVLADERNEKVSDRNVYNAYFA